VPGRRLLACASRATSIVAGVCVARTFLSNDLPRQCACLCLCISPTPKHNSANNACSHHLLYQIARPIEPSRDRILHKSYNPGFSPHEQPQRDSFSAIVAARRGVPVRYPSLFSIALSPMLSLISLATTCCGALIHLDRLSSILPAF
jgi:hypothetical protein